MSNIVERLRREAHRSRLIASCDTEGLETAVVDLASLADLAADAIELRRAENARLTEERNAFRTMAINHLWNHNLANAYGREEYQRQLDQRVDETLEDMLAKVKREGGKDGR